MKAAVIGAGPAGLAAAWELRHRGAEVDLFESHSKPGGCASYFRRVIGDRKVLFDAAATVLWGMEEGEFLRERLQKWQVPLPRYDRQNFHRYQLYQHGFELDLSNTEAWTASVLRNFPRDRAFIESNFPRFIATARALYKILFAMPAEPFFELRNLGRNLRLLPELAKLGPALRYPRRFCDLIAQQSAEFKAWVDASLIISLQTDATQVDSLYGMTALAFFPLGAGALEGGMASLFDGLAQNFPSDRTRLHFKTPIVKVSRERGYLLHSPEKNWGPYTHLFLSSPRWDSARLFAEQIFEARPQLDWERIYDELWSAVVAYLIFPDRPELPDAAFNHHVRTADGHFYFSWSKREDPKRNAPGLRVVTGCAHEKLGRWDYPHYVKKKDFPGRAEYEQQKKDWEGKFLAAAKVFTDAPSFVEVASPKTFHHYTRRLEGFVGGIPMTRDFSFWNAPSKQTRLPNLYQIGDTSFPGQSVVNTMVGAVAAVRDSLD